MDLASLTLDLFDLEAAVGDFAGFGVGKRFDDTEWNSDQQTRITNCVRSAERMVYFTQEMPGIPGDYPWSFLQPTSTIVLPQGETSVALPDDCNGIMATIIPASSDGTAQFPIRVVPAAAVYGARSQSPDQTGRPCLAYQEPVKQPGPHGSRYRLQVYPTPDADYTLQVWYAVSPKAMTPDRPAHYGGAPLSETFKAGVRAAYEMDYLGVRGVETERFIERLRAAIAADRKHKAVHVGVNTDHSDRAYAGRPVAHGAYAVPFLVNGVDYSEAV